MAPFLNESNLASTEAEHWCCQVVHKLTRKPVALAFPRPSAVVMFTTPWPYRDTLVCQGPLQQLVQPSITEHQKDVTN